MSSQLLNQLGAFLPLFSHPVRTSPADRRGATRCTCTGSALSSAALLLRGCDQTWAGWKSLPVRSGIRFSFCWLQNVHRPLKQAGFLSFLKLFCVCVHNCLEKRKTGACLQACLGWMLLRCGLRSSQPLLIFPSSPFVRARCFFLFSQLSAFCEHSFTLRGGLAVNWRAVQGEGQTEEQIRCSGDLKLKKYPVGLSLIALAGNACSVQKV